MTGIDEQSFADFYAGRPCPQCQGDGCDNCDWQGLVWPELIYTDADRAYDRQAFAADYGLRSTDDLRAHG